MAIGTAKPTGAATSVPDGERFIEQQLAKTRFQVRIVDLASSLMALVAAILAYVLVLAIVDHWIMPLAWWGRWLACISLLIGVAYYVAIVVVPLMTRRINPVYAARAIEEAEPTLKNSLINFLMFRNDRGSLHQLIYSAMQQRAAADLHRVPIESAVDRSKVIHFGYLLAGVLAICAAYTMFSPKDPLPSATRVLLPWANIQRPTRVKIQDVQPGDATVFQGDTVTISCALDGHAESVTLFYSTTDGAIDEQPRDMKLADDLRFECKLPPGDSGLQQAVTYRIVAGDAVSTTYRIEVSPAPHIAVQQLEYKFPAYTRRPPQTDEGQGDIKALEGTQVTICAKTNQPIRSAYVELNDVQDKTSRLAMEFHEQEAWRTITLELEADRKTPRHDAYQLRFVTTAGRESNDPILHRIEVLPDLAPEVSILTPRQEITEVAQDGSQQIEVRAIDPDFGVTSVRLHFVMGGTQLLDKELFADQQGVAGQIVKKYEFRPHLLGLQPGDRVVYRALAADNRAAVGSDSAEPREARTKDYQLLIIPPSKTAASPDVNANAEKQPSEDPKSESNDDPAADKSSGEDQAKSGGSKSSDKAQGGGEEKQEGASGVAEQGGEPEAGQPDAAGSQAQGGSDAASGGQPRPGQAGEGQQSSGNTPQEPGSAGGEQGTGQPQGPSEPLHDGEVFEKALQRLKQQAQDAGQQGKSQSSPGDPQGNSNEQGDGSKTSGDNEGSTSSDSNGNSQSPSSDKEQTHGNETNPSQPSTDPQASGKTGHEDDKAGPNAQKQESAGQEGSSKKSEPPTTQNSKKPGDRGEAKDETATGVANDKKPSDSQGESNGERSGGGSQGPGQGANQAGRDTPGQNTAADKGAGAANEAGQGETSSAAGDKQQAPGQTGSAGREQGDGSSSRSDPSGDEVNNGKQSPTNDQQESASDNNPAGSTGGPKQGRDGVATGGGLPSDDESSTPIDKQLDVPAGDEANLEYTRRATDMVLEYLKDQQDNPDRKLLEELGWTEAELAAFLKRWQQLKQSAAEDNAGKRELDESLRSLGLRPTRDRVRQGTDQSDGATGLRDSGPRTAPPAAYQELFDAFKKGAARATK